MQNILVDLKKIGLLILICLIISPLFPYSKIEAFSVGSYFGGRILTITPCTCNPDGSSKVTLRGSGSSSGTYLFTNEAKIYSRNIVKSGGYILGKYKTGGQCLMTGEPCYDSLITKGTIDYIGTSF